MKRALTMITFFLPIFLGLSSAESATVFGPETYNRSDGPPNVFIETFAALSGQATLLVQNGETDNKGKIKNTVTSAHIFVNDVEILGPDVFKKQNPFLEAPVDLAEENTLRVELHGKPGTFLSVTIVQDIPAPLIDAFSANPETISQGASSRLQWETENATNVVIDQGIGEVVLNGSILVSPLTSIQYTLTATNPGGAAVATVTVTVANAVPTVTIDAFPPEISVGESFELTWDVYNAEHAYIDNGIGQVPLSGSVTLFPEHTTAYTITTTGEGGSASAQVQVRVLGNSEPQPEGSFGWNYQNLIPADATLEAYAPKRFAVVTGSVQDALGAPLSDVFVFVHTHPEYGTVTTSQDGRFSIPVQGGGVMPLVFQKEGYITAHRKVDVPWNDIAVLETLKMITKDPASTEVAFDGNPYTIITHKSSDVTDEFGSRSCTLVFQGNNRAYALDDEGNEMFELENITVRATEFTTRDAMPARLPPNSGYTYCVELSADGVKNVVFEEPVITWVDNFLGFEVGEAVPVGYFDRIKGVWAPQDNGVVVRLLDEDMDGIVDALDADGDGLPDDLNQNGAYDDEVRGLDDPSRYFSGDTFWRVEITHFTPWDCNWPFGPPPDATPPNPDGMPDGDQPNPDDKSCPNSISSFVEDRSRIFHEDIPIPGTDIALHYAGSRVEGYKSVMKVPASGDTVPESLKSIVVEVDVAGRKLTRTLNPMPNQMAEFVWDGLDFQGNPVQSDVSALIRIGFVYDAVYYSPGDFEQAFAQTGSQVTSIRTRQEAISWKKHQLIIRGENRNHGGVIAEGWTLSAHHSLDPVHPNALLKGDGTGIESNINISYTVAGNGLRGYSGDGGPAIEASLKYPLGIAADNAGNLYIVDTYNSRIRKVDTGGVITTIAGNGDWAYGGDDGPAIEASFSFPKGIAIDSAGNLYIADYGNNRIRKVDTGGVITTIAGNGSDGYAGDDGLAIDASLRWPECVAIDEWGNVYIADSGNNRIRKVDTNGIITTVAGNGDSGYSGDGGAAIEASLKDPRGVAVVSSGILYIADSDNSRVRRVDTSGIINTVAGNGDYGYSGDGGPAGEASLNWPTGIAVDSSGNLYIADYANSRIRKVDTSGVITTVAGNGNWDFIEDGLPATQSPLSDPYALAVDNAGSLYIADYVNGRIFQIVSPSNLQIILAASMEMGDLAFPEDNGIGYIISATGRHKKTIDLNTGVVLKTFGYNEDNQLVSITDQFGNRTLIQRGADGTPTAIVSPDGLTTTLTTDADNRLISVSHPNGNDYQFEYTAKGLMTAETEPNGNRFEHQFDSNGRLTDATDEEGGHWHFQRTVFEDGDVATEVTTGENNRTTYWDHTYSTGRFRSTIVAPDGSETQYERSTDELTAHKWLPCGMSLDFSYDLDPVYKFKYIGEMTETTPSSLAKTTLREKSYQDTNSDEFPDLITDIVQVNGKTTVLENNVLQSQKTIRSPKGRMVTTSYDPNTLKTETLSISGLFDTAYDYDARGRLTSITNNTRETSFTYNSQGFLGSITDLKGYTTSYLYDPVGRVTGISRPDGSSLGFSYDPNGNMTVLTNPAAIPHLFGYNKVNLNSAYQTPLSGTYSFVYDKDRRLVRTNLPSGYQINNIYDKTRLMQIQTPEGNIDFTYLCGNKIGSITKGAESISYTYDGKLMTSEALSGTFSRTLSYGYNNDFDLESFTYSGDTVHYVYDNDGLLTNAGIFTISRNAGNGLPEEVVGDAMDLTRSFNGYGEVEQESYRVGAQGVSSWNLTRDDNGRITQKTETLDGIPSNYTYTYDPMGRLLTVTKNGTLVEEYQYGPNGARIHEVNALRGITGRDFTYSDGDHLVIAGDATYQYDVDGYLQTKTQGSEITTYGYSSRGELLQVSLPDGNLIEYLHDPLGRRIAKKVNGVTTEKYLWQGLTRLLAVYDGSEGLLMRFEYADARMPVAMIRSDGTYYLTYDQVGSLRIVADASGNVVKKIEYDSFGNIITDTAPAFEVPFGFAGGLHDRDTGLVRFGYRDFDPDVGRWTAKDPIGFAGGDTDLYGYCLNDPVNFVDPIGLLLPWGSIVSRGGGKGIFSGGPGALVGGIAGAFAGAAIGTATGIPGIGFAGALIGGAIGGKIGGLFDDSWDGQLNYGEDDLLNQEAKPCD